ncbi:MAG: nitrate reductase molybdenum cofactor assembly chaperone [Chloroflexota bacterium]
MSGNRELLQDVYAALANAWCSPQDVDREEVEGALRASLSRWETEDGEETALLNRFLDSAISEVDYVELFELNPRCPLYLGSHSFEEPQTCAQGALSDRNGYMTELKGVYGHLGMSPNGRELPDYLPLMVEFLALTAGSDDPIREKLLREYMLPYLPAMRTRLTEIKTPYADLLDLLERVMRVDLEAHARVASHA